MYAEQMREYYLSQTKTTGKKADMFSFSRKNTKRIAQKKKPTLMCISSNKVC